MNVVATLIADRESLRYFESQASVRSTIHLWGAPTTSCCSLSMPLLANTTLDGTLPQSSFALFVVVGFVGTCSFWGRFLGLPRGRLTGSMASINSWKTIESWTLAAVSITASGTPLRSETRWRFEPAFPLSVGFAPVFGPPF